MLLPDQTGRLDAQLRIVNVEAGGDGTVLEEKQGGGPGLENYRFHQPEWSAVGDIAVELLVNVGFQFSDASC